METNETDEYFRIALYVPGTQQQRHQVLLYKTRSTLKGYPSVCTQGRGGLMYIRGVCHVAVIFHRNKQTGAGLAYRLHQIGGAKAQKKRKMFPH